jgi:hypothetical protein
MVLRRITVRRVRGRQRDRGIPWADRHGCGRHPPRRAQRSNRGDAPKLRDAVWLKLGLAEDEALCAKCLFERAAERGINLTFADLRPCLFNLLPIFHDPTWFEFFHSDEPISDEWYAAGLAGDAGTSQALTAHK